MSDVLTAHGHAVNTGCHTGHCGACLVDLDGALVRSCLVPAARCAGSEIRTARAADDASLAAAGRQLSAGSGLQCGFCTPAFTRLIAHRTGAGTGPDRHGLSEVTCRCTGYTGIAAAAAAHARQAAAPPGWARDEDERLVGGTGTFVATIPAPNALHARVLRAPWPHATITRIDTGPALAVPGVVRVLTAADLPAGANQLVGATEESSTGANGPVEPLLAGNEVRYVGQPVALVLAESPAAATAGAAAVHLVATARPDEPGPESPAELPPDDDPRWLPELAQSVGDDLSSTVDTVDAVEVTGEFWVPRATAMPMETRGLLAEVADGRLTVHGVTKHPAANRVAVAAMTGLPEHRVEFPRGDVGGSFGVKGELYPEDLLIPWAAVRTGLPVRWIEDRAEHVVATNHSRGQAWRVRLTADRAGRLLAADVTIVSDGGAFVRPLTSLVPYLASAMFPGPYRLPRYRARVRQLLTTRTPIGTVRAPGRFEANTVREHMLDRLAGELGIDPDELRRRNLLAQQDMPHDAGTLNEGPVHYDTGDFRAAFEDGLRRAPAPPDPGDGLRRATATVPFVDKAGLGGDERAVATLLPDRTVRVTVACAPSGQAHQTMLAEVAATELGVDRSRIQVCFDDGNDDGNGVGAGDRDGPRSIGTFASRTAAHTGNAVLLAIRALAAAVREAAGADANEQFAAVATRAAAPVSVTRGYDTTAHTYPYGAVTCAIAVDPDLLTIRVEHLAISCDAGRPVHEPTVRGQLAGGLVMGVSAALLEQLTYRSGQPECTGLAGYPLALSSDVPDVEVVLLEPAPRTALSAPNPLGVKGIGEAGTAAAGAAVVAAVCRALPHLTGTLDRLPLTPSVLLAAARENADLLGAAAAR